MRPGTEIALWGCPRDAIPCRGKLMHFNKGWFVVTAFLRLVPFLIFCLGSTAICLLDRCDAPPLLGQDATDSQSEHAALPPEPVDAMVTSAASREPAGPTTYFFKAKWCGPCNELTPTIERLKQNGLAIKIVDVDDDPEMAKQFNVEVLPFILQAVDGKVVNTIKGKRTEQELREALTSAAARKARVRPIANCSRRLSDRALESHAPPGRIITNAQDWSELRKAWMIDESALTVDFDRQFLLVGTTHGSGISHQLEKESNGNLKVGTMCTADLRHSGFTYLVSLVDRDDITTVNGQPLQTSKPSN